MTNEIKREFEQHGADSRGVDNYVHKHVIGCASMIIADYVAATNSTNDLSSDADDTIDWLTGPLDWTQVDIDLGENGWKFHDNESGCRFQGGEGSWLVADNRQEAVERAAEMDNVDIHDYQSEVYEHWIVSDHLSHHLKKYGETVFEFHGFQVWARTTSGQSIASDYVIGKIYCDVAWENDQKDSTDKTHLEAILEAWEDNPNVMPLSPDQRSALKRAIFK